MFEYYSRWPRSAGRNGTRPSSIPLFSKLNLRAAASLCRNRYAFVTGLEICRFGSIDDEGSSQNPEYSRPSTSQMMNAERVGFPKLLTTKASAICRFIFTSACLLSSPVHAASWVTNVDQRNGLPALTNGGATAMSSDFVFWGKNWTWAALSKEFKVIAPYEYSVVAKNQVLNFFLTSQIRKVSNQQLVFEFDLDAHNATIDVIGGGIDFELDLTNFGSELGQPELLPGNRGWSWGRRDGTRVEMRFDPPMASVYFERGNKSEIRAFFYKGEVPEGRRHYVATLNVSGDVEVGPTIAERFGLDDEPALADKPPRLERQPRSICPFSMHPRSRPANTAS